mmetsp:Transcript_22338/g.34704  ORF Transcript_22338/g.34704 Transcript_22338/m.34704 type:complete len:80 (+) Transcript_22338:281-520(+)
MKESKRIIRRTFKLNIAVVARELFSLNPPTICVAPAQEGNVRVLLAMLHASSVGDRAEAYYISILASLRPMPLVRRTSS